jgi:hypothetical protein
MDLYANKKIKITKNAPFVLSLSKKSVELGENS